MTDLRGWFSLTTAATTAVIIGFTSTILLVVEAAKTVGANADQQASTVWALCIGMAISTLILSWCYRMPVITAWSTPGAALIATSGHGIAFESAIGAYVIAGALTCLAALIKPLGQLIEKIPAPIAAAMLAGVLLKYCLLVPNAMMELPLTPLPILQIVPGMLGLSGTLLSILPVEFPLLAVILILVFFTLRMLWPMFAVPAVVVVGIGAASLTGEIGPDCCSLGITWPIWTAPHFDPTVMLGLGVPLFLVTMASQNLPGFAVLRASGYEPPVSGSLWVTGLGSMALAPLGSHAINLAAITASLVTGPDSHPDPGKRWLAAWPYLVLYTAVGVAAASFVSVLGALPSPLIVAIAGLALFSPLLGSVGAMMKEPRELEAALLTFLVTASGLSVAAVGSAFWGLLAGVIWHFARRIFLSPAP